jgi:hypothetical protein
MRSNRTPTPNGAGEKLTSEYAKPDPPKGARPGDSPITTQHPRKGTRSKDARVHYVVLNRRPEPPPPPATADLSEGLRRPTNPHPIRKPGRSCVRSLRTQQRARTNPPSPHISNPASRAYSARTNHVDAYVNVPPMSSRQTRSV